MSRQRLHGEQQFDSSAYFDAFCMMTLFCRHDTQQKTLRGKSYESRKTRLFAIAFQADKQTVFSLLYSLFIKAICFDGIPP